MKPPRFLLGAALLFWGWQTGFLLAGAIMAVVLESGRFVKARWEFADQDVSRIWTFCSVLFLVAIIFAFTANDGVSNFASLFGGGGIDAQRRAGETSSRTAVAMIRWLPMVLFLFVSAQSFNTRTDLPLATISLIFRRRLKYSRGTQEPPATISTGQVLWAYFAVCLCAASAISATLQSASFFAGFGVLMGWTLWPHRSRRFGLPLWAGVLGAVLALGYAGQRGIVHLQQVLNNYNPQWFSLFSPRGFDPERSRTALGQIGELKTSGRIVIRVRTEEGQSPPNLLREASYREYQMLSWQTGEAGRKFEYLAVGGDGTTWELLTGATNTATVNIACAIPGQRGLLPLPRGSTRLDHLPDYVILSRNGNGAVLAEQAGLVIFDAQYGRGQTIDAGADTDTDLQVPDRERPALRQVLDPLELAGHSRDEKLRAIRGLFANHFGYSLWQRGVSTRGTNETPLARFLLETRSGHCEYFATATVLLLRELSIPARYAVGYAVHEGSNGRYVVRQRDAHAWCLVWNEDTLTWEDFDTTPASWIEEEGKRASMFQWLSDGWSRIKFEIAKVRWGQTNVRRYLLWALIPVLGFLLYQIVFRRRKLRRAMPGSTTVGPVVWPGLDSEFYLIERKLEDLGFERQVGETANRWLERIEDTDPINGFKEVLHSLVQQHYRLRFDPLGLSKEARATLREQARSCLSDLERVPSRKAGN